MKDAYFCKRKMESSSCERGNLRINRRRVSVGGEPLKQGPSARLSEPGPPVRPLKEKELGPFGELSTSNPGAEVPEVVAPEFAPNVSACGADDVDMRDEVAQRGVSDAESVE